MNYVNFCILSQLDFWKDPISVNQPVDIRVPPNRITHLRKHFLSNGVSDFEVIVDNIQTLIDAERTHRKKHGNENTKVVTTLEEFDYSVYHSADEVSALLIFVSLLCSNDPW